MTTLTQGTALFFTREELAHAHLIPETLTQEEALTLIRRVFRQTGRPMPPHLEIHCFPDRHGVLLFLQVPEENWTPSCYASVTFS